jgi:hypothetical protein
MSEPKSTTCTPLSEVLGISHDSVNLFLLRENDEPKDLFNGAKRLLNLVGGKLNVVDSILDKPYSQHMELIGYFWFGKHHRVLKGLNLITLYYTDPQGRSLPVNYRVYDKAEGKTKNDYFIDMLGEMLAWGLQPDFMTGDSWYSCIENLNTVKNHRMGFMFAVESNRRVSTVKGSWVQVQKLDVPEDGMLVWLREFGNVKLFRMWLKDRLRHYVVFLTNTDTFDAFEQAEFQALHDHHLPIEQYHRMIKQVCNKEKFQMCCKVPILNHIFTALCAYIHLQQMQFSDIVSNAYQWQRALYRVLN